MTYFGNGDFDYCDPLMSTPFELANEEELVHTTAAEAILNANHYGGMNDFSEYLNELELQVEGLEANLSEPVSVKSPTALVREMREEKPVGPFIVIQSSNFSESNS